MATSTSDRPSARDRLLAAAGDLFYEEGVHTVGIDRLIEVAKIAEEVVGRPLPGHLMRGGTLKAAKQKAAAVGGDFIVWEDSLGTLPVATPTPGEPAPSQSNGELGHSIADAGPPPEETTERTPKARFTVGIFLPDKSPAPAQ